jgi:hypothetical protein
MQLIALTGTYDKCDKTTEGTARALFLRAAIFNILRLTEQGAKIVKAHNQF